MYETYREAFTPGLIAQALGDRVSDAVDGWWWAPSGRVLVDPARYYLPVESVDAFGNRCRLRYDDHARLSVETEDPLATGSPRRTTTAHSRRSWSST